MFRKLWDHLEEYLLVSSLVVTVFLVFMQVVMRYVFQNSLSWSEELARYLFLWQIWLGASYAAKKKAHLRIEAFLDLVPPGARRGVDLFALLVWFGFSVFLAWKGSELAMILFNRGQVSPAMRMPMGYAYASVPVGAGLMAVRLVEQIVAFVRSGSRKREVV